MKTFIPQNIWKEEIFGWTITGCAVRGPTIVCLVARKKIPESKVSEIWDHDITTRTIALYLDEHDPDESIGVQDMDGFNKSLCGVARIPLSQGLVVSRNNDGDVCAVGGGRNPAMEYIDRGKIPMTQKVKCIDGYAYSVGRARSIYKRANIGHWVKLDNGFPNEKSSPYIGFYDLDGFSESDLYAVGGHGDVWHYDGTTWMQEGFPSNMQLHTVTCADDGYVYVTSMDGTMWRGRNSTWEHLYDGNCTIPWNDVLWFEDKLWLASDYMLRIWDGKNLVPVTDHEGNELPFSGHMDARDGLLVIADSDSVMAYQNGLWRTLVAPYDDE